MAEYLKRRPFLVCAIGCIIASVLGFLSETALLCFSLLSVVLLITFLFEKQTKNIFVIVLVILCCFSALRTSVKAERLDSFDGKSVGAKFVVEEITNQFDNAYFATAKVLEGPEPLCGTKISVRLKYPKADIGDILEGDLTLSRLDENRRQGSYSYNVFLDANCKNTGKVGEDGLKRAVHAIREHIKSSLFRNMDSASASTLCALIFGDKSYFSDDFYSCVKGAGVSHVMVVSGMHLSILISFGCIIFEKLFYNRHFKILLIVAIFILLGSLCLWTGSIKRAGLCYLIMALGLLFKQNVTPENSLGAAVCLILIHTPFAVFNIGLQLSALSTFGILSVALPINRYLTSRKIIRSTVAELFVFPVTVTLAALLLTLPVVICVFGYISKWSVITNLLINTAVSGALCIAVAALFGELILGGLATPLFKAAESLTTYINKVIVFFGKGDNAVIRINPDLWTLAVLVIIITFIGLLACKKHIDMVKLEMKHNKTLSEGGKKLKWR